MKEKRPEIAIVRRVGERRKGGEEATARECKYKDKAGPPEGEKEGPEGGIKERGQGEGFKSQLSLHPRPT